MSRAILHHGPLTEGNQTSGGKPGLHCRSKGQDQVRSTQDGDPTLQVPRYINPREPAALGSKI